MKARSIRRFSVICLAAIGTLVQLLSHSVAAEAADGDGGGSGQQAFGITSSHGKWFAGIVPFVYNSSSAPAAYADDAVVEAIFQEAIAQWEGYCNITFVYGGVDDTADVTNNGDGIAVFEWNNDIGGAAGRAGPAWTTGTMTQFGYWMYLDGSFKVNPDIFTDQGSTPGDIVKNHASIVETATHELGHLIGLGHSSDPLSIMSSNPYNSVSHVLEDDIKACREIYGYSDVYVPIDTYEPPAAGVASYDVLFLSTFNTFPTAFGGVDDGTLDADDTVMITYQNTIGAYDDDLVHVYVDPYGVVSTAGNIAVTAPDGSGSGFVTFGRLRETPGQWTVYTYDSTGLLGTFAINVTTAAPVGNLPPTVEFTLTDNPGTRTISVTADVTGDPEGDNATLRWFIPSIGQVDISPGGNVFSDTQNVTFNDNFDWEMWAVLDDDHARYTEDLMNNIGPAGPGFHSLYRYMSSGLNAGPDLDGDNSSDVVWRHKDSGKNWLYSVKGNLIVDSELINVESDTNWHMVGFGDFNADGRFDILWRHSVTGRNVVYIMDGSTVESTHLVNTEGDTSWKVAGVGDFDGDGDADILWRHAITGKLFMYIMNGTAIQNSFFVASEPNLDWQIFGTGDMNGDGKADILWRNVSTGWNWVSFMNGSVVSSTDVINKEGKLYWKIRGNGDYNGDGFADILWRHELPGGLRTGWVWIYLMQGNNILASVGVAKEADFNWQIASTGDFNGDGYSDILWRNTSTGKNWMYQIYNGIVLNSVPLTDANFSNTESDQSWEIQDFN